MQLGGVLHDLIVRLDVTFHVEFGLLLLLRAERTRR